MWILSYKKYAASKMATFISVIGALVRYGGFLCLFAALIPGALVCLAIGIGMHYWAENIAFNTWKKQVKATGVEDAIRQGNMEVFKAALSGNDKFDQYLLSLLPADIQAQIKANMK